MNLYEIGNGYMTASFVRVYIFAETDEQAIDLARQSFQRKRPDDPNYVADIRIVEKVENPTVGFVSEPDGEGLKVWGREPMQ